jgi:uncharacterized membrane protein YebE (DUF533 family)
MSFGWAIQSGHGALRTRFLTESAETFMLKKLIVFAITSGLAAKLYKSYVEKQDQRASRTPAKPASGPQTRRPAQKKQA